MTPITAKTGKTGDAHLAKVGVESSNLFARSSFLQNNGYRIQPGSGLGAHPP